MNLKMWEEFNISNSKSFLHILPWHINCNLCFQISTSYLSEHCLVPFSTLVPILTVDNIRQTREKLNYCCQLWIVLNVQQSMKSDNTLFKRDKLFQQFIVEEMRLYYIKASHASVVVIKNGKKKHRRCQSSAATTEDSLTNISHHIGFFEEK